MSVGGYKIRNPEAIHFITFAVVEWVDVFTRKDYCDIVLDSLRHCQLERGLIIHGWCLMSNHIHLVVSAKNEDTSDILRDFKKFTSKQIIKAISENKSESRREWMLEIFKKQGEQNSRNIVYQFWRQDNQPKELFSIGFTWQKMNYMHDNPVVSGLVEKAEDYQYSSARDYVGKGKGLLEIHPI
jgi:REP element-mobilizing transposase RayT